VDATPRSDSEYSGTGSTLTARNGDAAKRIDLLSVLAHELGHAMGFAHSETGVMAEGLQPGERATPDRWLTASAAIAASGYFDSTVVTGGGFTPVTSAAPLIDWGKAAVLAAGAQRAGSGGAEREAMAASWQSRFVNHLGATPERMNPNAKLRLHVEVTPRVVADLASVEAR